MGPHQKNVIDRRASREVADFGVCPALGQRRATTTRVTIGHSLGPQLFAAICPMQDCHPGKSDCARLATLTRCPIGVYLHCWKTFTVAGIFGFHRQDAQICQSLTPNFQYPVEPASPSIQEMSVSYYSAVDRFFLISFGIYIYAMPK